VTTEELDGRTREVLDAKKIRVTAPRFGFRTIRFHGVNKN
jgi:hypothetical protein